MGPKSRLGLLTILLQLITFASTQELYKRAPQGFFGMRGKKYSNDEFEHFYKRKPQFFVGVKGKKSLFQPPEDLELFNKRAPMGFVGMRGKKETYQSNTDSYDLPPSGSLIGQIDYTSNFNDDLKSITNLKQLLNEYFHGQPLTQKNDNAYRDDSGEILDSTSNEIEKRATNMNTFFGVRGKKSVQNKRPFDINFRGKFIGVRGKKDGRENGMDEINFLLNQEAALDKRAAHTNGFFGMRGKKGGDDSTEMSQMEKEE